jgi:Fe-S cluster assembly protein SufD
MNAHSPSTRADNFLARYDGLKTRLPGAAAARANAAAELRRAGLPDKQNEDWKYTSLRPLSNIGFHQALTLAGETAEPLKLPQLGPLADYPRLVFLAGRYRADLSIPPTAITPKFFADAPRFSLPVEQDPLVTLNTLLAEDGAAISVPADTDAGTLILLHIASDLNGTPAAAHPRHSITLAQGGTLTLIDISSGNGAYLHNPVTEITLAEGAHLTHLRLQTDSPDSYHLSSVHAKIAARATYEGFTLTVGARLARSEIHAHLEGPGAHAALNAAQILHANQHADFTTIVSHDAPSCTSRQTVKNVLAGHARGVFQGKIEVARAAQKTDGYQMNQALLLSPDAEIDCKPQLEIYADDVKCSHGATVGELDPDQIFYLTSRGIPNAQARGMLVRAFLTEALDLVMHEDARTLFEEATATWWRTQDAVA